MVDTFVDGKEYRLRASGLRFRVVTQWMGCVTVEFLDLQAHERITVMFGDLRDAAEEIKSE